MTGKGEFTEGLGRDTRIKLDLENVDLHALFATKDKKKSENSLFLTYTFEHILTVKMCQNDIGELGAQGK